MWQVVSGTANLLGDCDLLAVVQTVAGDGDAEVSPAALGHRDQRRGGQSADEHL
jgi:hypothetical protein